MKILLFLLSFLLLSSDLEAQTGYVDSLKKDLLIHKADTARSLTLSKIANAYQDLNPDSALLFAQEAYQLALANKYLKGEAWSLNELAAAYNNLGNFPKSLDYYLQELKIEELRGIMENITSLHLSIALVHTNAKDYESGLRYAKKADSLINLYKYDYLSVYSLLNIGDIFEKLNFLDSALNYTYKCLSKSQVEKNDLITGTALNNLGNIYSKSGKFKDAEDNYRAGLRYLETANDFGIYAESMLGLAKIFQRQNKIDSAIYYARQSFAIAHQKEFTVKALDASVLLTELFKGQGRIDSSFSYQEIMVALKDSMYSRERVKDLTTLNAEEQMRQKDLALQRELEAKELEQKLQLLMIGISIPLFFLLSVVISKRKVNKKLVEFFGIVSILLLFEYITLLLHPFIAEKTHHNPFYEIIIFVLIAAVITPLHHRFQHWVIHKLTEYNSLRHQRAIARKAEESGAIVVDISENTNDNEEAGDAPIPPLS